MLLEIHPENPQERHLRTIVDCLKNDGVIIYPTDTVYGIGCDITSRKAVERVCQIRGLNPEKAQLACICEDLKIMGDYALHVSTPVFKIMKQAVPGPYTFILQASKNVPRHFQHRRKTVGLRVVDHPIVNSIVKMLGNPLLSASLKSDEVPVGSGSMWVDEYDTDPWAIHEKYGHLVDYVIDGGIGGIVGSTILDCSAGDDSIIVVREGLGDLTKLGIEIEG